MIIFYHISMWALHEPLKHMMKKVCFWIFWSIFYCSPPHKCMRKHAFAGQNTQHKWYSPCFFLVVNEFIILATIKMGEEVWTRAKYNSPIIKNISTHNSIVISTIFLLPTVSRITFSSRNWLIGIVKSELCCFVLIGYWCFIVFSGG